MLKVLTKCNLTASDMIFCTPKALHVLYPEALYYGRTLRLELMNGDPRDNLTVSPTEYRPLRLLFNVTQRFHANCVRYVGDCHCMVVGEDDGARGVHTWAMIQIQGFAATVELERFSDPILCRRILIVEPLVRSFLHAVFRQDMLRGRRHGSKDEYVYFLEHMVEVKNTFLRSADARACRLIIELRGIGRARLLEMLADVQVSV